MYIDNKMLIVFVIICPLCRAILAARGETCDIIQFGITEPGGSSRIHDFTKQNFIKHGQPVYYSLHGTRNHQNETIIMWNNEAWIGQTRIYDEEKQREFEPIFKIKERLPYLSSPFVSYSKD